MKQCVLVCVLIYARGKLRSVDLLLALFFDLLSEKHTGKINCLLSAGDGHCAVSGHAVGGRNAHL